MLEETTFSGVILTKWKQNEFSKRVAESFASVGAANEKTR